MPEQITSPSNKRIQWLRSLHSLRGRAEAGAFLVEGPHLLEAALDAHLRPQLIVYDDEALSRTPQGTALLRRIGHAAAGGVEILLATAPAIERASEAQTPQGVVAALALAEVTAAKTRGRRRGRFRPLVLILDAVTDPGNVGTLLRSALAADVDEVLLSTGCADPFAPKVVRAGSGAHFTLPIRAGLAWGEISRQLRGAPTVEQTILADVTGRRAYDTIDMTKRTAIIVSNEAHGASAEALGLGAELVHIPMWNKVESLNAAIAGSVILFEAARQRRVADTTSRTTEDAE
jgi:TrmH family RNA methyltransferase